MTTIEEFKKHYNYASATPMMQQYLDLKFDHLDCLLLFRMGDFYELFFDDAVNASRALSIALTKRGKNGEEEVQMCGVPHHALENYLHKLIEEGYKVAICDQLETPEAAKKRDGYKAVVRRGVTRIITPGTITEESLISTGAPNYLASVVVNSKKESAICYVDLSTSEFSVETVPFKDIVNELARLSPKEILFSQKQRSEPVAYSMQQQLGKQLTYQVESFFSLNKCKNIILDFYKIADIKGIGDLTDTQISAIGSVIEYLSLTQKTNLSRLPFPKIVNYHHFMTIDASARRNLELVRSNNCQVKGSVLSVIDATITKAGSRLLHKFLNAPLVSLEAIVRRQNITSFFYENLGLVEKIQILLKNTADLERCLTRIALNRSTPRDLISIKNSLSTALKIKEQFLNQFGLNVPEPISKIVDYLSGDEALYKLILNAIVEEAPNSISDGGFIKPGYHDRVRELYDLIDNGKSHVEKLKLQYRKETGVESLKISHNNVLGLFIDVTSRHSEKLTDPKFIHRQTTVNNVRYTTIELQTLESDIVNARSLVISLEQELYRQICQQVIEKSKCLTSLASALSMLDVFCNLAHIASENNYVRPILTEGLEFDIVGGRHVVVEKMMARSSSNFIENDCNLSMDTRIWLLTGPNMSGKSTFLKQNAIIAILAQIGSFVPAKSAKIGIVDKVFSRIGAGDDLSRGQSTFMLEMLETSAILSQSTERSLIILDEVGRGTSTYDGVAIAWAVLEYIHNNLRSRCLFATHYHELTTMSGFLHSIKNYTIAIEELEQEILFLHKIVPGAADKSYGIHVAQLAGLPKLVIATANKILNDLEQTGHKRSKNILRAQSNNLSLFDLNADAKQDPPAPEIPAKYKELELEVNNIDPDELSPKEALEQIYRLKRLFQKDESFSNIG